MFHPSHKTRYSDASTFDEVCEQCGATDEQGSTRLSEPCPNAPPPARSERDAFLAALAADEDDATTRLVYADWLDEHDMPEEATRQRAWPAAKAWVTAFAPMIGQDYASLMDAAAEYHADGWYTRDNSESYKDVLLGMWAEFWGYWETLTGKTVRRPEDKEWGSAPFTCSC